MISLPSCPLPRLRIPSRDRDLWQLTCQSHYNVAMEWSCDERVMRSSNTCLEVWTTPSELTSIRGSSLHRNHGSHKADIVGLRFPIVAFGSQAVTDLYAWV